MINISVGSGLHGFLRQVKFDTTVWLASLATAALLLLYILPLPPSQMVYLAELGVLVAIGIALFAMLHGLSRIPLKGERFFWLLIGVALAFWLAGQLVYFFELSAPRPGYLYLIYYIAVFIAIDHRPHLKSGWASDSPRCLFATASALVLTAGFLSYFVLVPSVWSPRSDAVLDQHYVYLFLDAIVALRFFKHYRSCRSKRWRHMYGLLALAGALILAGDLRDFLHYAEILPVAAGGWLDVLYYLPHAALIAATRLRNSTAAGLPDATGNWPDEAAARRGLPGQLWAFALLLPTVHLVLSYIGLLDRPYRAQLDLCVLFFSLVLTALAIIQLRFAERKKSRLASQFALLKRNHSALRREKASALRRFSGGVAHLLNNLLQIIFGYGQMLLSKPETDRRQRAQIEGILNASAEASKLTEQLRAFSRTLVLQPTRLELNTLLGDRHHRLQRAVDPDIVLSRVAGNENAWIDADPNALFHALKTLVRRAGKSMRHGSELTLTTRILRLKRRLELAHCLLDSGDHVVLSIRCGGWSPDRKDLPRLFEPFAVESGPDGLDLATVQGVVVQSGGSISASVEPGRSLTFDIFLPLAAPPAGLDSGTRKVGPPAPIAELRTVLLVDDDEELREMLHESLSGAGIGVLLASNGEQALEMCRQYHDSIDLLLTDVVMPKMGGFDLAEQVSKRYPDIHILFMSGHVSDDLVPDAATDWKTRFLSKPFDLDELQLKFRELFG